MAQPSRLGGSSGLKSTVRCRAANRTQFQHSATSERQASGGVRQRVLWGAMLSPGRRAGGLPPLRPPACIPHRWMQSPRWRPMHHKHYFVPVLQGGLGRCRLARAALHSTAPLASFPKSRRGLLKACRAQRLPSAGGRATM